MRTFTLKTNHWIYSFIFTFKGTCKANILTATPPNASSHLWKLGVIHSGEGVSGTVEIRNRIKVSGGMKGVR